MSSRADESESRFGQIVGVECRFRWQDLASLESLRRQLSDAQEGPEAADENRHINIERFRAGSAIALEVLDAEDRLADARLDLASVIVEYNLAQARLLTLTEIGIDRLLAGP